MGASRPLHMGCVVTLVGCPLSHGCRRASVSAAASVGDGRSPLGCITRAGRRECHAKGMTERATRPRRARALVARTGAAFSRQSRLPARSVLNGPHWGPGPPRRELTAEALRRSGKALRCFPSFFLADAHLRSRARSQPFEKGCTENFYARFARPLLLPQHIQCLHQLLLLHPAQLRGFHRLLQVLLHPPQLLFL